MGGDQKRFVLAIALSGIILFGWQFVFAPKKVTQTIVQGKIEESVVEKNEPIKEIPEIQKEKVIRGRNYLLSNFGMKYQIESDFSLIDVNNEKAKFLFKDIVGDPRPFALYINKNGEYEKVNIALVEKNNVWAGNDEKGNLLVKFVVLQNGKLNFQINSNTPLKYRFIFKSKEKKDSNKQERQFISFGNEVSRVSVGKNKDFEGLLKWAGVDFEYHLFSLILREKAAVKLVTNENGEMIIDIAQPVSELSGDFVYLQKNYDDLISLGDGLNLSVDFGLFGILAVPMLRGMQLIYKYIPNYGIAIIILTFIIRLLLYPLQQKSFKSMKKMQVLQPELNALKEKFKDDPKRMQQETMQLFKRGGANPLGGCLPLLLQMPVFFAIFKVLGNAVELVQAPFFGWIKDLSIKDPYYVLPVLMCISMLVQQKVTPTPTADPMQKKMMLIMPIVFGFIMKDLPSGLSLYIFASTIFGLIQQYLVYKFDK